MSSHERRPLVLTANRAALRQAAALLPTGACLEQRVHDAIVAGRIDGGARAVGAKCTVELDGHVVVTLERAKSPMTGRKAWRPVEVKRRDLKRPAA